MKLLLLIFPVRNKKNHSHWKWTGKMVESFFLYYNATSQHIILIIKRRTLKQSSNLSERVSMESGEKRGVNVWVEMTAIVPHNFCFFEGWNGKWQSKKKVGKPDFCDMQCFDTFHFHSKRVIFNEWDFKWKKWKLRERERKRRICLSIDKSADGNICLLSQESLFTEIYFFLPCRFSSFFLFAFRDS